MEYKNQITFVNGPFCEFLSVRRSNEGDVCNRVTQRPTRPIFMTIEDTLQLYIFVSCLCQLKHFKGVEIFAK